MGAKNLLLLIVLFLAAFSPSARADMADTFNMALLSHDYALPCNDQAALRHANILPPHFSGRPAEFLNESESLALYSPHLTPSERKAAQKLFRSLPDYALPIAWRGGAVYVFVRRGIVEAVPALAYERDWFEDFGLYMQVERRMYIPFEKGENFKGAPHGKIAARRWVPTTRDQFRVINHETGHMIDEMLGAYSHDSKGDDGQFRLSNRPDYLEATKSDLARLASNRRPIDIARIHKLGYYMPHDFKGFRLGIQTEQRARREVFAELWAEVHGFNSNKLYEAYPDTYKVVKSYADFVKAQDKAAPVRCEIGG
jgi:hypothetical protein